MATPAQKVTAKDGSRKEKGIDWADYAKSYDVMAKYNSYYAANVQLTGELIRSYSSRVPARICDLGAGTGNYLTALSRSGIAVDSLHVDSSVEMNQLAVSKYHEFGADVDVLLEDVTRFAGNLPAYDVYLCVNCLYAIPERDEFIRRLRASMPLDSIFVALDFGRKMRLADWVPSMARNAFAADGPAGLSRLLRSGFHIAKHNASGAVGQTEGLYWVHSLSDFVDFFVGHGLEVMRSGVCYKGYCDYVVVRR